MEDPQGLDAGHVEESGQGDLQDNRGDRARERFLVNGAGASAPTSFHPLRRDSADPASAQIASETIPPMKPDGDVRREIGIAERY